LKCIKNIGIEKNPPEAKFTHIFLGKLHQSRQNVGKIEEEIFCPTLFAGYFSLGLGLGGQRKRLRSCRQHHWMISSKSACSCGPLAFSLT